ncbi:MAG: hypothetical protein ACQEUM_05845 [Pseudomonadota bacterium]
MTKAKSQFVGAAGQYYVCYELARRGIHASLTVGNAPAVDIVAAKADGSRSLSIQVKTSRGAYRRRRYGREGCEWDVGAGAIGKHSPMLWYALVDLQKGSGQPPRVFIVPSFWVSEFVLPSFSRKVFFLPATAWELTEARWDRLVACLDGEPESDDFATHWPADRLVRWGVSNA